VGRAGVASFIRKYLFLNTFLNWMANNAAAGVGMRLQIIARLSDNSFSGG
jgi:hypothetical protein